MRLETVALLLILAAVALTAGVLQLEAPDVYLCDTDDECVRMYGCGEGEDAYC